MDIPFNIPCSVGTEPDLVRQAIENRHLSGNGPFTRKVHRIFSEEMGFPRVLLTHSCTGALEMAGLLLDLQPGDEVILPSFTHVGTANALERAGATLRFADSLADHPNLDPEEVERLWGPRTRAVVVVHYAGVGCEMEKLRAVVHGRGGFLVEDAAHGIGATYLGQPLGSWGDLAAFSFHETKNLTCGQGGMLVVNRAEWWERALQIWENGTNRAAFFRGETDHYTWVDTGSCFLPSDLNAAYLYGQLVERQAIFDQRFALWDAYRERLSGLSEAGKVLLPGTNPGHNAHIFYLKLADQEERDALRQHLHRQGIMAVFHYIPLHSSPYFAGKVAQVDPLPNCQDHSETLLRLPLYHSLTIDQVDWVSEQVKDFFGL